MGIANLYRANLPNPFYLSICTWNLDCRVNMSRLDDFNPFLCTLRIVSTPHHPIGGSVLLVYCISILDSIKIYVYK